MDTSLVLSTMTQGDVPMMLASVAAAVGCGDPGAATVKAGFFSRS